MDNIKKINLFCFPFAGGSSRDYLKWKKFLNSTIELYPVELAGRGKRFKERHYYTLDEAIDDLYSSIEENITNSEYSFFGHSMGCILAYYLSQKISAAKKKEPNQIS